MSLNTVGAEPDSKQPFQWSSRTGNCFFHISISNCNQLQKKTSLQSSEKNSTQVNFNQRTVTTEAYGTKHNPDNTACFNTIQRLSTSYLPFRDTQFLIFEGVCQVLNHYMLLQKLILCTQSSVVILSQTSCGLFSFQNVTLYYMLKRKKKEYPAGIS